MKKILNNKGPLKLLIILIAVVFIQCNSDTYPYFMEETFAPGSLGDIGFSVIIDVSGSMATNMPDIQSELHSLVDEMTTEDYMQFIITGTSPTIKVKWDNDIGRIRNSIDTLSGSGDSERYDLAITKAVNNSMKDKLNVVLLFGDGRIYSKGEPSKEEVLDAVKRATNRGRAIVYTFDYDGRYSTNLKEIATTGRGKYYDISIGDPLGSIYNDIKIKAKNWINE